MSLTAETLMNNRPLLPREVAERWGCSERHVRNLITSRQLGHLRVGKSLPRIPAAAVEEFERRQPEVSTLAGQTSLGQADSKRKGSVLLAYPRINTRTLSETIETLADRR